MEIILHGTGDKKYSVKNLYEGTNLTYETAFEGVIPNMERHYLEIKNKLMIELV